MFRPYILTTVDLNVDHLCKQKYSIKCNNVFLPYSNLKKKKDDICMQGDFVRLEIVQHKGTQGRLSGQQKGTSRLIEARQNNKSQQLKRLASHNFTDGRSVCSFIPKLEKAVTMVRAGNNQYLRGEAIHFSKAGKNQNNVCTSDKEDGVEEVNDVKEIKDFLQECDLSFLMLNLGCHCLAKTANYECDAFSLCHAQQPVANGVIPVHCVLPSYNIYDIGCRAIRCNM